MSRLNEGLEIVGVACENCVGACCRAGAGIQMTENEVYDNRRKMNLERVVKARNYPQSFLIEAEGFDESGKKVPVMTQMELPARHGLYLLKEDCGHLTDENQCGIYEDRARPKACGNYPVGSAACLGARQAAGLIDPELPDLTGL